MTVCRGMTYPPTTDEWENVLSHTFHVHYCQAGMATDTSFLFVALHLPDYWWISPYFHGMAVHFSFCTLSICTPRPFFYCETRLFFLLAYTCLHIFSIVILHLPNILKFSSSLYLYFTHAFDVMLREPPGWKIHFSLYSSSIYVVFHLWLFNLCGIYFCAWWEWLV